MSRHMGSRWVCKTIIPLLWCMVHVPIAAQSVPQESMQEFHPQLLGAGGAYSGLRGGLPTVSSNPALLSEIPTTVTYFSLTSWIHSDLPDFFPAIIQLLSGDVSTGNYNNGIPGLLENSGFGMGSSIIGGAYGGNFSAVVILSSDFFFYGDAYPEEVFGSVTHDVRLSVSFAYPFIWNDVRLSIGLTIDPFYRTFTFFPSDQAALFLNEVINAPTAGGASYLDADNTLYGSGVAFHAGILLVLFDQVSVQAAIRDIGDTPIFYSRTSLQSLLDEISNFSLPPAIQIGETGYEDSSNFVIPFKFRMGVSYHPTIETRIIVEPVVSVEFSEFLFTLNDNPNFNILHAMNIGAQVTLNKQFTIQIGLSQGEVTAGAGFDFGIFDLHTAWFGIARVLPEQFVTSHGAIISFQFNDLLNNS